MSDRKDNLTSLVTGSLEDLGLLLDSGKTMGKPVAVNDDLIIIPVTRVTFGFGSGGSEFGDPAKNQNPLSFEADSDIFPYGGGSLGGVSIRPEAFIMITKKDTKIVKMDERSVYGKALDMLIAALKKKSK